MQQQQFELRLIFAYILHLHTLPAGSKLQIFSFSAAIICCCKNGMAVLSLQSIFYRCPTVVAEMFILHCKTASCFCSIKSIVFAAKTAFSFCSSKSKVTPEKCTFAPATVDLHICKCVLCRDKIFAAVYNDDVLQGAIESQCFDVTGNVNSHR